MSTRRESGSRVGWFAGSIALHLLFFAVLAFTPARKMIFDAARADKSTPAVHADRIEEVIDHLRQREQRRLSAQVEELFYVEEQMEKIHERKLTQYKTLSDDLSIDAPDKALKALEEALAAQKAALDSQQAAIETQQRNIKPADSIYHQAQPEIPRQAQSAVEDARKAAMSEQADVKEAQARASDAQNTADRNLYFATEFFSPAKEAQQEALKAQAAANTAQDKAAKLQNDSYAYYRSDLPQALKEARNTAGRLERVLTQSERRQREFERIESGLNNNKSELREARQNFLNANEKVRQAEAQVKTAARLAAAEDSQENSRALKKAERDLANAKRRFEDAEKRVDKYLERIRHDEERLAEAGENLKEAFAEIEPAQTAAAAAAVLAKEKAEKARELQARAEQAQFDAAHAQAEALDAQTAAASKVREALAESRKADFAYEPPDSNVAPTEIEYDRLSAELDNLNLAELYDKATDAESRITDKHQQIKAASSALEAMVPMDQALAQTMVARTPRPQPNTELLTAPIRTGSAARAHKEELTKVRQELYSMVSGAYQRLSESLGMGAGPGDGNGMTVSIADIKAAAARAAEMREGALEDAGARFKDISSLMQEGGFDSQPQINTPTESSGPAGSSSSGSGSGNGGQGRPGAYDPYAYLPKQATFRTLAATRFKLVAPPGIDTDKWTYLDAWYTIGPFPNPNRRNIDTRFPPESVVDLDAVYTGKDGRPVRWQFVKSPGVVTFPADAEEYSIYYAYTELHFDQACDLLIAVGSDDNSRIWINDHLVWMSSRELKGWRVDEGFRKVHFKTGINRILYRVENGWRSVLFSFLIQCYDPAG